MQKKSFSIEFRWFFPTSWFILTYSYYILCCFSACGSILAWVTVHSWISCTVLQSHLLLSTFLLTWSIPLVCVICPWVVFCSSSFTILFLVFNVHLFSWHVQIISVCFPQFGLWFSSWVLLLFINFFYPFSIHFHYHVYPPYISRFICHSCSLFTLSQWVSLICIELIFYIFLN